jgi:hypothetical protein
MVYVAVDISHKDSECIGAEENISCSKNHGWIMDVHYGKLDLQGYSQAQ